MNHFFLLNEAIDLEEYEKFKWGMAELVAIEREAKDTFLKHKSVWDLAQIAEIYSNYGQYEQAISKFIEQLTTTDEYINNEELFDMLFQDTANAFLGINFSTTKISDAKWIINNDTFQVFKNNNLWSINYKNLWLKRELLFPNLILCGEVEEQIYQIGTSSHFNQIVNKLKEFNTAIQDWKNGNFSYKEINQKYALIISPESDQTMAKYKNERKFRLPTGDSEYCELHIKAGDLRFHFYPNNSNRNVYIAYIGPHLSTISN